MKKDKSIFSETEDFKYVLNDVCISFSPDGRVKLNGQTLGKEPPAKSDLSRRTQTARLIIRALNTKKQYL